MWFRCSETKSMPSLIIRYTIKNFSIFPHITNYQFSHRSEIAHTLQHDYFIFMHSH